MTAEPAEDSVMYFSKAHIETILIGCMDQDGPVHGVSGVARFFHFKTISE